MPETQFVRVKQVETGHHLSLPAEHVDAAPKGAYEPLKSDATDAAGAPLPAKYKTTVSTEADKRAGKTAAPEGEN